MESVPHTLPQRHNGKPSKSVFCKCCVNPGNFEEDELMFLKHTLGKWIDEKKKNKSLRINKSKEYEIEQSNVQCINFNISTYLIITKHIISLFFILEKRILIHYISNNDNYCAGVVVVVVDDVDVVTTFVPCLMCIYDY